MKFKYLKNNILILFLVAVILLLGIFVSFTSTNWFKQRQIEDVVKKRNPEHSKTASDYD